MPVSATQPLPTAGEEPAGLQRFIVLSCLLAGTIIVVLDSTIANVALPYIQGSMSASREQITWVLTSYVIASAIMTAPVGWISARFGRKNLYIFSLLGFTLASALCGAAQSLEQLVLCRVLQGALGAALAPLSQSMIIDLYPPQERAKGLALYGSGVMIGPIMGPTVGGYITDALNWRWVFYINVPIGIAAIIGMLLFRSKGLRKPDARFDWSGFAFVGFTLASLQLLLDRGHDQGWFESSEILTYAVCAGIGLYLSAVHLATAANPFISRVLLTDRSFIGGFIGFILIGIVISTTAAVLPPYLQQLSGYTVLDTGLIMSPRGFGTIIAMQVVSYLGSRVDLRLILLGGILVTSLAMLYMASWTPEVGLTALALTSTIQGFGTAALFAPLNMAAFASIPVDLRTDATAMINLARSLGGAVGVAVSTAFLASQTQIAHADLASHVTPFNRALQLNGPGMMWNSTLPFGAEAIEAQVERQAEIIAYADNFLLLAFTTFAGLLIFFLIRTPKNELKTETGHME